MDAFLLDFSSHHDMTSLLCSTFLLYPIMGVELLMALPPGNSNHLGALLNLEQVIFLSLEFIVP